MKNTDWLTLPIFLDGFWSQDIRIKAKKIQSHNQSLDEACEEIANGQNIGKGIFVNRAFPYDKIALVDWIQEDPDDTEKISNIYFLDDEFYIVNLPYRTLLSKINTFLSGKPLYRNTPQPQFISFIPPHPSEINMGDKDEEE